MLFKLAANKLCFVFFFLLNVQVSFSQVLDKSFGNAGWGRASTFVFGNDIRILIQPDGKIIQAGSARLGTNGKFIFILVRYNANGSLDNSFGVQGKAYREIINSNDQFTRNAVLQSDGKILVTGNGTVLLPNGNYPFAFTTMRFNSNGTVDESFGNNGVVQTVSGDSWLNQSIDVVVLPDGKIVVAGLVSMQHSYNFMLVKYNSNGSLDNTFGDNGIAIKSAADNTSEIPGKILLQQDGKLVVLGWIEVINGSAGKYLSARFNADGTPDTDFGNAGSLVTDSLKHSAIVRSGALQTDGKILSIGDVYSYINYQIATSELCIVRQNVDGLPDNSFGTNGVVKHTISLPSSEFTSVLQQGNKILAVGSIPLNGQRSVAIVRLHPDGKLDSSFGNAGIMTYSDLYATWAFSGAFQDENHLVVGGAIQYGTNPIQIDFFVNRIIFPKVNCNDIVNSVNAEIPDAYAYPTGTQINTVYPGFTPATSITYNVNVTSGTPPYTYNWSTGSTGSSATLSPIAPTTYYVTVTDNNYCQKIVSKPVNVIDLACGNNGVKMCHYPSSDKTHSNDVCIGAGTNYESVLAHLAKGCILGECPAVSQRTNNVSYQTSIIKDKKNEPGFKFGVYPTISNSSFKILVEGSDRTSNIQVYDVAGRIIEQISAPEANSFTIGAFYKPGTYYVRLTYNKQTKTIKVVKL